MNIKRTSHAVYEAKYHLVWCPKYRKKILKEEIQDRVKELFIEIADHFDFEIDVKLLKIISICCCLFHPDIRYLES